MVFLRLRLRPSSIYPSPMKQPLSYFMQADDEDVDHHYYLSSIRIHAALVQTSNCTLWA